MKMAKMKKQIEYIFKAANFAGHHKRAGRFTRGALLSAFAFAAACLIAVVCAALPCAGSVYAADGVTIPLTVENKVTGDVPGTSETFTFVLAAESPDAPLPDNAEIKITASGEASFGNIAFTDEGQYLYMLYELIGDTAGYSYDTTVYHILVDASYQGGKLVTQVVAWKGDTQSAENKVSSLTFENKYSDPDPDLKTYIIYASAGEGGAISPSGRISASEGDSLSFTVTAKSGYKISDVTVDGKSVGAVSSYTFENITADHVIVATFEKTDETSQTGGTDESTDSSDGTDNTGSSGGTDNTNGSDGTGVTDKTNGASNSGAQTGDSSNAVSWIVLAAVSACAILAVIIAALIRRKKKDDRRGD